MQITFNSYTGSLFFPQFSPYIFKGKAQVSIQTFLRYTAYVLFPCQEMDIKFAAMHRTVLLLKKYNQSLPDHTQELFNAAPGRWNNLKTKVSLAKQRLGPRIQEESDRITKVCHDTGRGYISQLVIRSSQSVISQMNCFLLEFAFSYGILFNNYIIGVEQGRVAFSKR